MTKVRQHFRIEVSSGEASTHDTAHKTFALFHRAADDHVLSLSALSNFPE